MALGSDNWDDLVLYNIGFGLPKLWSPFYQILHTDSGSIQCTVVIETKWNFAHYININLLNGA